MKPEKAAVSRTGSNYLGFPRVNHESQSGLEAAQTHFFGTSDLVPSNSFSRKPCMQVLKSPKDVVRDRSQGGLEDCVEPYNG